MSEEQKAQWLSIFPAWPESLLEKFKQAILIDFYRFGIPDDSGFITWWGQVISPPAQNNYIDQNIFPGEKSFSFSLLSPQNPRYATTARWNINFWYGTQLDLGISFIGNPSAPQNLQLNLNNSTSPQSRLPCNLHVFIHYDPRLYQSNFQWNYAVGGNLSSIERVNGWPFETYTANYSPYLIVAPNASAVPYNAVDTILAMHENGVDHPAVDYALMYDYQTYRDAIMKYSTQINSKMDLLRHQSAADINAYKQDYNDRAQREINDLSTKKFQILQAMDNEKKSAIRDYQSQILAAQNLKLSLQNTLRG